MPHHASPRAPAIEFAGWLVSMACRPVVPLIDLIAWFTVELCDTFERRVRWYHGRWRWPLTCGLLLIGCAVLSVVSTR